MMVRVANGIEKKNSPIEARPDIDAIIIEMRGQKVILDNDLARL